MPAKSGEYLRQYSLLSASVEVAVGSEPALYTAVDLLGAPSINARGVVLNSRDGFINVCTLGTAPVKVANGATIVKGNPVSINATGEVIAALPARSTLGIALESVTAASGDFIEIYVSPQPFIPAT